MIFRITIFLIRKGLEIVFDTMQQTRWVVFAALFVMLILAILKGIIFPNVITLTIPQITAGKTSSSDLRKKHLNVSR